MDYAIEPLAHRSLGFTSYLRVCNDRRAYRELELWLWSAVLFVSIKR